MNELRSSRLVSLVWRILLVWVQHSRQSRKTTLQPWRTWYGKTSTSQSRRWHHYWTVCWISPSYHSWQAEVPKSVCKMGTQAIDTWNERDTWRCLSRASASVWGWWWSISAAYRHWGWDLGTLLRARTKATKHGMAPHLIPKTVEGASAMICRQSHFDFLLGLQWANLRALHAQRKHCDQCHLLKPSEEKSEASYSPETARVVDDGSVSPPRQCEATYCYRYSVDYWGAAVWVLPTPFVLTQPRAFGFSRLRSIEGCTEQNAVSGWRWG